MTTTMIRSSLAAIATAAVLTTGLALPRDAEANFVLSELIDSGGSVTVGDKLFSNFSCDIVATGLAGPSLCSQINVNPLDDDGDLGIQFQANFIAVGAFDAFADVDVLLGYTVTVLDPKQRIHDASVDWNFVSQGAGSFKSLIEEIRDEDELVGALILLSNFGSDSIILPGLYTSLDVVKDIGLFANSAGDLVFGSRIDQRWSQVVVPIPAALPMLGAAIAGLGFAGWRKRKASSV